MTYSPTSLWLGIRCQDLANSGNLWDRIKLSGDTRRFAVTTSLPLTSTPGIPSLSLTSLSCHYPPAYFSKIGEMYVLIYKIQALNFLQTLGSAVRSGSQNILFGAQLCIWWRMRLPVFWIGGRWQGPPVEELSAHSFKGSFCLFVCFVLFRNG